MINYRWQCLVCESGNEPDAEYCIECGCPIDADTGIVEGWIRSRSNPPKKPNNIGYESRWGELHYKFTRTAPCPYCRLHMYISDAECPHCDCELSLIQRHDLIKWQHQEQSFGRKLAIKIVPGFILIMAILFYGAKNF